MSEKIKICDWFISENAYINIQDVSSVRKVPKYLNRDVKEAYKLEIIVGGVKIFLEDKSEANEFIERIKNYYSKKL